MGSSMYSLPLRIIWSHPHLLPLKHSPFQRPHQRGSGSSLEQRLKSTRQRDLLKMGWRQHPPSKLPQREHSPPSEWTPKEINIFRRYFKETIKAFHPKAQVCKSKLQICTNPSEVGFIMYIVHTLSKSTSSLKTP